MFIPLTFQVAHNQMFPFFEASRTVSRPLQVPVEHNICMGKTCERRTGNVLTLHGTKEGGNFGFVSNLYIIVWDGENKRVYVCVYHSYYFIFLHKCTYPLVKQGHVRWWLEPSVCLFVCGVNEEFVKPVKYIYNHNLLHYNHCEYLCIYLHLLFGQFR